MQENQLRIIDEKNMSFETANNRLTLFDHMGNVVGFKSLPIPISADMKDEDLEHYCKESGYDITDMMDNIISEAITEGTYDVWLREDYFLYLSPTTNDFSYEPYEGVFSKLRVLLQDYLQHELAGASETLLPTEATPQETPQETALDETEREDSVPVVVVKPTEDIHLDPRESAEIVDVRETHDSSDQGYQVEEEVVASQGDDFLSALNGSSDFGKTDFSSGIVGSSEEDSPNEESTQKFYDTKEEEDVVDLKKERAAGEIVEPTIVDTTDNEETRQETVVATPAVLLTGNAAALTPTPEEPQANVPKKVLIEMPLHQEAPPVSFGDNKERISEWKNSYAKMLMDKKKVDGVSVLELRSHAVEYILKRGDSVFEVKESEVKLHLVETLDVVFDLNDVVRAAFYEAYMLENVN